MIELAIKAALERITGMAVYPLLLPDTVQEGVTFQRISDPEIGDGLARTGLVEVRMQINMYILDNYTRLLELDQAIWREWKTIIQGTLETHPVQYIERGSIQQSKTTLTSRSIQYAFIRDYILTIQE